MRHAVVILVLAGCAGDPWAGGDFVDLTHDFSGSTIYWPTAAGFSLQVDSRGMTEQGYYYEANSFSAAEHGGTHIDAPVHFAEGRPSVDQIPLTRLIGPAVVVDVSQQALGNRDFLIGVEDLQEWEARHGAIPQGAILLLRTGYGRYWPDPLGYLGTSQVGEEAVAALHFPGLDPAAAQWLVANRSLNAIGLDTASIDSGQSTLFESHRILFAADIPAFENVANLAALPPTGAQVIALPMKIKGGSGGPLRIIAWIPH
jgi:kynurenine formamidase